MSDNEKALERSLVIWRFVRAGGAIIGTLIMFGGTLLSTAEFIPRSTPWNAVVFLGSFIGGVMILGAALVFGSTRIDQLKKRRC